MNRTTFITALIAAATLSAPVYADIAPVNNTAIGSVETVEAGGFFPRNRQVHSPRAARQLRGIRSNNPHQGAGD